MPSKIVLFIDHTLTFGGAINSLRNLTRALNKDDYCPVVVTGQSHIFLENSFSHCLTYRTTVKLPWMHNSIYNRILSTPLGKFGLLKKVITLIRILYWIIIHDIPDALKYYRIGRTNKVQIVHLNNIFGSQLSGILAAKLLRVPCVAHLRDFEQINIITRLYAKFIDHHIAISAAIKENLLNLGIPKDRITIIHDSIDIKEFHQNHDCAPLFKEFNLSSENKTFGIFGRIVEWKGTKEFVLAAKTVLETIPNSLAFIVGDCSSESKEYLHKVKLLTQELNVDDKIVFTGYRSDVPQLISLMDVIVHASTTPEPFGMVIIEGMAMGKPIIATAGGGPLDIVIDGETGILVPLKNPEQLADAIIRLLSDSKLRQKLGSQGRVRVENCFSHQQHASKVKTVYDHLLLS